MYSWFIKSLFALTALTPIALVYAWVAYSEDLIALSMILLLMTILLDGFCYIALKHAHRHLEAMPFKYNTAEPADQENISFILLYLSPLFVNKISDVNLNVLIPTLTVYGMLVATSYTFQYNPLIALMGWHFYKVESREGITYVLLTTKKIKNIDQISKVGQLTGYMLLDLSG